VVPWVASNYKASPHKLKMAAYRPNLTRISKYERDISELPRETGSGYEITYISACIHDNNEISKAIPMFSMSSNTTRLI